MLVYLVAAWTATRQQYSVVAGICRPDRCDVQRGDASAREICKTCFQGLGCELSPCAARRMDNKCVEATSELQYNHAHPRAKLDRCQMQDTTKSVQMKLVNMETVARALHVQQAHGATVSTGSSGPAASRGGDRVVGATPAKDHAEFVSWTRIRTWQNRCEDSGPVLWGFPDHGSGIRDEQFELERPLVNLCAASGCKATLS